MVLLHLLLQDVAKRNRYPDPIPVAYSMRRLLIIIAQVDILIFSYMFHNTQKGIKNRLTIFFTLLRVWLFKTGYNRRKKKLRTAPRHKPRKPIDDTPREETHNGKTRET